MISDDDILLLLSAAVSTRAPVHGRVLPGLGYQVGGQGRGGLHRARPQGHHQQAHAQGAAVVSRRQHHHHHHHHHHHRHHHHHHHHRHHHHHHHHHHHRHHHPLVPVVRRFKYFDKNSDNAITAEELQAGLNQLNIFLEAKELDLLMQVQQRLTVTGVARRYRARYLCRAPRSLGARGSATIYYSGLNQLKSLPRGQGARPTHAGAGAARRYRRSVPMSRTKIMAAIFDEAQPAQYLPRGQGARPSHAGRDIVIYWCRTPVLGLGTCVVHQNHGGHLSFGLTSSTSSSSPRSSTFSCRYGCRTPLSSRNTCVVHQNHNQPAQYLSRAQGARPTHAGTGAARRYRRSIPEPWQPSFIRLYQLNTFLEAKELDLLMQLCIEPAQ
jgi:hypothetical protein